MTRFVVSCPAVTATTARDLYYDPYDVEITADPYAILRRLREEAPLYYHEEHDFYALSRCEDIEQARSSRWTAGSAPDDPPGTKCHLPLRSADPAVHRSAPDEGAR
jgi:hypothetical protein